MREKPARPGRTLTEEVTDIDRSIIRLLLKRHQVLQRLAASRSHLNAKTEQMLRTSWEKYATRVSRDPKVTRQLFSLLQEIHFLPKPDPDGESRRAFGLAPAQQPVTLSMPGPKACRRVRMYLALAAGSGQPLRIDDSLLNDPLTECVKAFNQAGGQLAWQENGSVLARAGAPLPLPDKVIFTGDDSLNFHLLLGHYLGRASHAKFTGDSKLKLNDFSTLRHFTPLLGARLTNVVPGARGLPVRLEASGMLPQEARIPADLPADAVTGLLLAAPCWPQPVALDLASHPQADVILDEALDILTACRVGFERADRRIRILPGVTLPAAPAVGVDLALAGTLLALPACTGGSVRLTGLWPDCAPGRELLGLMESAGVHVERTADAIVAQCPEHTARQPQSPGFPGLPIRFVPLALALACLPVLRGREARLPELPQGLAEDERDDFLHAVGITLAGTRLVPPEAPVQHDATPWTAPSPAWAMAYALAAFARPRLQLANPGIMSALYPRFWTLYNTLPEPWTSQAVHGEERNEEHNEEGNDKTPRKRVRLSGVYSSVAGTVGETAR
ncbi:MAG: 3-phosphoshikimate 1-carboxyvinyltransferase [Deltaproteobacteria bacterium]|jgi:5-enolpyruvylshikimate-3-phosphate synthase|nr:3-phosphoshikimate 1-carboxyvinyltransferase [Deltaproteobacteria bacterium]